MSLEVSKGFRLEDRDLGILREVARWKFALSRQLAVIAGFPSKRTCYGRLRLLVEAGYLERRRYLYGVAGLYTITPKVKELGKIAYYPYKVRVDQICHDIAVVDTAIYLHQMRGIPFSSMLSGRELHSQDGFGVRKHQPDIVYEHDGKRIAVEVEMTAKAQATMDKNVRSNYTVYDGQLWVVPESASKVRRMVEGAQQQYGDIEMITLEQVERA